MATERDVVPLPTNPEEFTLDDRISFSKVDSKFVAVQENGEEFEFDHKLGRWVPLVDDEEFENWQAAFAADPADNGKSTSNKRKADDEDSSNGRSAKQAKKNKPRQQKQNSAVYVTGLPLDATIEEVKDLFQRKCGMIAEEIDSGRPRIKLYTDSEGKLKGDALIVFFKPQSVEMAITLLDETDFRVDPSGQTTGKMRVQAADMSYKKTKQVGEDDGNGKSDTKTSGGNKARDDKAKIIKKTQKLDAKLADWDEEPSTAHIAPPLKKSRIVVLEHMFTLQELKEDPAALLDIKEDIRDECSKFGTVTNVVLYDLEEDGIVRVKFKDADAAELCIQKLHGRAFGGQVVEAYFATGKEKFKKSKSADGEDDGDMSD